MSENKNGSGANELGFDPDALREKYRIERDRRMRPEGEHQYVEVKGKYQSFMDEDPFAPELDEREPITGEVEVIIIGGGWGGMIAAARLNEAGINDVRIIDAGSDFGGTWYWNRYPGCQCDIESYCYLPLLEETGYIPKEKYSYAPEIFEHAQRIGTHYGLYENAIFQTRVEELRWDESINRWQVKTNRGDQIKARFVITSPGSVSRPKLPGMPGLDDFEGKMFHTCRWDFDYTGGDNAGNLTKLAGKRVAVIGTGATGVQCIPHVGAAAEHLYVVQRTPSSVGVRGNKPTDPEWAKSLTPGWQKRRQDNFDDIVAGRPVEEDLVNDSWTEMFQALSWVVDTGREDGVGADAGEIADFVQMNRIRDRVAGIVKDPETAEALKPYYRQFCKRPTFNDDFLPTFNRPNVTLVDTSDSQGVEKISAKGFVANGKEYEVDCIIFATGFESSTSYKRRIGVEIFGEGGQSLYDYWGDGQRTLHGHSVHGFPNWFFVGLSQVGPSFNFAIPLDSLSTQIAYIIKNVKERGGETVQPTVEGEAAWVDIIRSTPSTSEEFLESCTPGYYNNEGKFRETSSAYFDDFYAPGCTAFENVLQEWRAEGTLDGIKIS